MGKAGLLLFSQGVHLGKQRQLYLALDGNRDAVGPVLSCVSTLTNFSSILPKHTHTHTCCIIFIQ